MIGVTFYYFEEKTKMTEGAIHTLLGNSACDTHCLDFAECETFSENCDLRRPPKFGGSDLRKYLQDCIQSYYAEYNSDDLELCDISSVYKKQKTESVISKSLRVMGSCLLIETFTFDKSYESNPFEEGLVPIDDVIIHNILTDHLSIFQHIFQKEDESGRKKYHRIYDPTCFIPFVFKTLNREFTSEEALVWASSELDLEKKKGAEDYYQNTSIERIWSHTRSELITMYYDYPIFGVTTMKVKILILCTHFKCPDHPLLGKDYMPFDMIRLILGFCCGCEYFDNISKIVGGSKKRNDKPTFYQRFLDLLYRESLAVKINKD